MDGSGTFNGQILVDKLAKLNNTQQSIETLSHWCIFHRKRAKHVVETWGRQFHSSPIEQRVPFLYLANDILQNSRRKGAEFVAEFWKVLPAALSDVYENGGDFGRNTVLRLVDIWEERKVFGSRGQVLKDELLGRTLENRNRNSRSSGYKLLGGDMLQKLTSSFEHVYGGSVDEDSVLRRCQNALVSTENIANTMGSDFDIGKASPAVLHDLQAQYGVLKECIDQLRGAESSRASLVSLLREATHEQEMKLEQVHKQLQLAVARYEHLSNICQQFNNTQLPSDERVKETSSTLSNLPHISLPDNLPNAIAGDREVSTDNLPNTDDNNRKSAAAEVAAKLTASSSSAEMLSYVLSSLASEGAIGHMAKEDYPSDNKRPKMENGGTIAYIPQSQPPLPPFPHPDAPPPPPPSISSPISQPQPLIPLMPPLHLPNMQFAYNPLPMHGPPLPGFPPVSLQPPFPGPPSSYQNFQPTPAPPPISRE